MGGATISAEDVARQDEINDTEMCQMCSEYSTAIESIKNFENSIREGLMLRKKEREVATPHRATVLSGNQDFLQNSL